MLKLLYDVPIFIFQIIGSVCGIAALIEAVNTLRPKKPLYEIKFTKKVIILYIITIAIFLIQQFNKNLTKVPDVENISYEDACMSLKDAGLTYNINDDMRFQMVCVQSIEPNEVVWKNTYVELKVNGSNGKGVDLPEQTSMPEQDGSVLQNSGLLIIGDGNMVNTEKNSETKPEDNVDLSMIDIDYRFMHSETGLMYMLNENAKKNNSYYFNENCSIVLLIENNDKYKELQITNFSFYANKIERKDFPYLKCEFIGRTFRSYKENCKVSLSIENDGVVDAEDICLKISDSENILNGYYEPCINIPIIKVGQKIEVDLIDLSEFVKNNTAYITTNIKVDIECESLKDFEPIYLEDYLELSPKHNQFVSDKEGCIYTYGILVNSLSQTFTLSKNISENIKPGATKNLFICFFPDHSCLMEFDITLEFLYKGKTFTKTIDGNACFNIPKNIATFDVRKMGHDIKYDNVTFPFKLD